MVEALEYTAIKTSIGKVESFAQFVHLENEEIMINHFLDKINIFTKDLNRLTDLIMIWMVSYMPISINTR